MTNRILALALLLPASVSISFAASWTNTVTNHLASDITYGTTSPKTIPAGQSVNVHWKTPSGAEQYLTTKADGHRFGYVKDLGTTVPEGSGSAYLFLVGSNLRGGSEHCFAIQQHTAASYGFSITVGAHGDVTPSSCNYSNPVYHDTACIAEPLKSCLKNTGQTYTMCTADACPGIAPLIAPGEAFPKDKVIVYTTQESPVKLMVRSQSPFTASGRKDVNHITFDEKALSNGHPIIGFGGAFTDATSMVYRHLLPALQTDFLQAYYGNDGVNYSTGRVPISSNDFSCRDAQGNPTLGPCDAAQSQYSYDDVPGDDALVHFHLAPEDTNNKIPLIASALKTVAANADDGFKLFASVWSAPAWMKDNNNMIHGSLLPDSDIQAVYAHYLVKFLQAYKDHGIYFWGMTVENEPNDPGIIGRQSWQSMYSTADEQAEFIQNHLGPTVAQFSQKTHLMIHDDDINGGHLQDVILPRTKGIMQNTHYPNAKQYIDGVGLHWYTTIEDSNYDTLDQVYQVMRDADQKTQPFILATEACEGVPPLTSFPKGPDLGSWHRGEAYGHDILEDLTHHVSGWTDWNEILTLEGGPTWANNNVDSPILADLKNQILYKQPMYYYMGQFSKFIRPGAQLVTSHATDSDGDASPLEEVVFVVPATSHLPKRIVVVVLNRDSFEGYDFDIHDSSRPELGYIQGHIEPNTIQTFIYAAQGSNA